MASPAPAFDDADPTFAELIAGRPHLTMNAQDGLTMEDVPLSRIAAEVGTPAWVYSAAALRRRYHALRGALDDARTGAEIHFAVKANPNLAVLRTLAAEGAGADIVSEGELRLALAAGIAPGHIVYSGVGKSLPELRFALSQGVGQINAESAEEVEMISAIATALGVTAQVALRVNPDVDAKTHAKITTGKSENKFGIDFDQILDVYARVAADCPNLFIKGLQMHIGSQLTNVDPFLEAVQKVIPLVTQVKKSYGIEFFSIGGGIGINYRQSLDSGDSAWWQENAETHPLTVQAYADAVVPHLAPLGLRILCEPGRFMVGNAGVLLTKVLYEKRGSAKIFKIVDAGMNDLIRPTLYEGWHQIVPLKQPANDKVEKVDVVGPICESGDFLAQNRELPLVNEGDYLAVLSAGAYGFTMASNYNTRPMPAEILVEDEKATVVRERQTLDDVLKGEHIA